MICPKCGKDCEKLLAMSRFSDDMICSPCGNKEAFETLLNVGVITQADYEKKCKEIDKLWKNLKE